MANNERSESMQQPLVTSLSPAPRRSALANIIDDLNKPSVEPRHTSSSNPVATVTPHRSALSNIISDLEKPSSAGLPLSSSTATARHVTQPYCLLSSLTKQQRKNLGNFIPSFQKLEQNFRDRCDTNVVGRCIIELDLRYPCHTGGERRTFLPVDTELDDNSNLQQSVIPQPSYGGFDSPRLTAAGGSSSRQRRSSSPFEVSELLGSIFLFLPVDVNTLQSVVLVSRLWKVRAEYLPHWMYLGFLHGHEWDQDRYQSDRTWRPKRIDHFNLLSGSKLSRYLSISSHFKRELLDKPKGFVKTVQEIFSASDESEPRDEEEISLLMPPKNVPELSFRSKTCSRSGYLKHRILPYHEEMTRMEERLSFRRNSAILSACYLLVLLLTIGVIISVFAPLISKQSSWSLMVGTSIFTAGFSTMIHLLLWLPLIHKALRLPRREATIPSSLWTFITFACVLFFQLILVKAEMFGEAATVPVVVIDHHLIEASRPPGQTFPPFPSYLAAWRTPHCSPFYSDENITDGFQTPLCYGQPSNYEQKGNASEDFSVMFVLNGTLRFFTENFFVDAWVPSSSSSAGDEGPSTSIQPKSAISQMLGGSETKINVVRTNSGIVGGGVFGASESSLTSSLEKNYDIQGVNKNIFTLPLDHNVFSYMSAESVEEHTGGDLSKVGQVLFSSIRSSHVRLLIACSLVYALFGVIILFLVCKLAIREHGRREQAFLESGFIIRAHDYRRPQRLACFVLLPALISFGTAMVVPGTICSTNTTTAKKWIESSAVLCTFFPAGGYEAPLCLLFGCLILVLTPCVVIFCMQPRMSFRSLKKGCCFVSAVLFVALILFLLVVARK